MIPGSRRFPREANDNSLQYSCLENATDRGAWRATVQFSSVQSLSRVQLFATPWTAACQASLSITNSWTLLKLIHRVGDAIHHLILCRPLLFLPSVFPTIRVFSKESVLYIRWLKYWPFSFSTSPSNEYSGLISFRMEWFDVQLILITM